METLDSRQILTSPQPIPSSKSFKKLVIIIFAITAVLLFVFGGGGYYYLEIYQPTRYAKEVIPIYDELRSQPMERGNPTGSDDYEDILRILDQYQTSLTQINNELFTLKPSPLRTVPSFLANTKRSQQIQEDFTKTLEQFLSNISKAKKQAQFMIRAKELFLLLRPDLSTYPHQAVPEGQAMPLSPSTNSVGEFLNVWEARIPKAKLVAQDLFSQQVDLGEVSFDELKSLWLKTSQGYDIFIPFLKRQDPNLTLSEVQKFIPEDKKAEFDKADDAADQFLPLLEKVLIRNSAENILRYQFEFNNSKKEEFETRFKRLDNNIKQLKEKYGE